MTSPAPETAFALPSLMRLKGLALRHIYLYRGSWPRLLEMIYWPMLNIALFGFVSLAMIRYTGHADLLSNAYFGGILLAEIITRAVMAVMVMYMEEVWSRNLGHLFASPLRLRDYMAGLLSLSAVRCFLSLVPAYTIAALMFNFNVLSLGAPFFLYAVLLCMTGWWYGLLIISMLMRFGLAAEWLGWMCTWVLMPFMAPYYPVSVLPAAFQVVSWLLPGTYVFESMKQQLATGTVRYDYLALAFGLNLIYLALAALGLSRAHRSARRSGGFLQMGE